jgi:hypothetical protein
MWRRIDGGVAVVTLGLGLFIRGLRAECGTGAGLCFVSALATVQAWMVASGIAKALILDNNIRNACFVGARARFGYVFLLGACAIVSILPMAFIGVSHTPSARFATFVLGGTAFSGVAALIVRPCSFRESRG